MRGLRPGNLRALTGSTTTSLLCCKVAELGAYQAGVYEELSSTAYQPDWIAGVSIGAINAALIAGNPPERRIERLSEFWHLVSSGMGSPSDKLSATPWLKALSEMAQPRGAFNRFSAVWSAMLGIPGFY